MKVGFTNIAINHFSFQKRLSFCSNNNNNNKRHINKVENDVYKNIEQSDCHPSAKKFMMENCIKSKWYNQKDYVDTYIKLAHFKNQENDENTFYNAEQIGKIMEINPASVNSSYINTIIELIQEGSLPCEVLQYLENNWCINDELIEDIELLYDVIVNNKDKTNFENELKNKYIKEVETVEDGINTCKIGDAFQVKNEKFIRIKILKDCSKLMNITKDKYYELFPPLKRFSSVQNETFGDCYLIEPLMLLYQDPNERANIVSFFSQNDNNDVIITFPNGYREVTFINSKMPFEEDNDYAFSKGAKGYMFLEYAFAKNKEEKNIIQLKQQLDKKSLQKFERFLKRHKDEAYIDLKTNSFQKFDDWKKENNKNGIDTTIYQYIIANGGFTTELLDMLGYDILNITSVQYKNCPKMFTISPNPHNTSYEDAKKMIENSKAIGIKEFCKLIEQEDLFKTFVICLSIKGHQYGLRKITDSNGETEYRLYNPHSQAFPVRFKSLEKVIKKATNIQLAQKSNIEFLNLKSS